MKVELTDKYLEKVAPTGKAFEISDARVKGFVARVSPTGEITFGIRHSNSERRRCRYALGSTFPVMRVTVARKQAQVLLRQVAAGIDPAEADRKQRQKKLTIKEIAIDRWNATQLSTQLSGDGFEMIGFGQGFASMSAPTKELERRVIAREINHGNNPVLRWMASNVSVKQDPAGNLKPDKSKSTERIDGIVAALMALGRYMVAEEERRGAYEEGVNTFV